jgi:hypothetical protein
MKAKERSDASDASRVGVSMVIIIVSLLLLYLLKPSLTGTTVSENSGGQLYCIETDNITKSIYERSDCCALAARADSCIALDGFVEVRYDEAAVLSASKVCTYGGKKLYMGDAGC